MKKLYDSGMITRMFFRLLPVQILLVAVSSLNGIIASAVASNFLGAESLAVIGLFAPVDRLFETVNTVMMTGSQILCGQYLGKNQVERTRSIFSTDLLIISFVSILGTVCCLFLPGLLALTVHAEGVLQSGFCAFSRGRAFGIPAMLLSSQFVAFLQLEHQEKRTYFGIGVMLVSNGIMNLLFVTVFDLGVFGLGLANSLSSWFYCIFLGTYYLSGKASLRFEPSGIKMTDIPDVLRIGLPGAVGQGCQILRRIFLNAMIIRYIGNDGLSALTAVCSFEGLFFAVTAGVVASSRVLISVYTGEEDRTGLRLIARTAFFRGIPIVFAASALIAALAVPLTRIYCQDPASAVYQMTKAGFLMFPFSMPLSCFYLVLQNFHQCFRRMKIVTLCSVFDGVLGTIIFASLLTPGFGLYGIWATQILNGVLTALVLYSYAVLHQRKWLLAPEELAVLPADFGVPETERMDLSIHSMAEVVQTSAAISEFCRAHGITGKRAMLASLAMEEMAGNVVQHGLNDGRKHHIDVRVVLKKEQLMLRLKDDCRPFDPRERAAIFTPEDVTKNIGIRMISGLAEEFSYQNMLGLNVLTVMI